MPARDGPQAYEKRRHVTDAPPRRTSWAGILLFLLGVPIPIIILLALFVR
jgi:hypothetical protein